MNTHEECKEASRCIILKTGFPSYPETPVYLYRIDGRNNSGFMKSVAIPKGVSRW
jgi:hypothetical protein